MKSLTEHLSQYAAYHRDKRNILTHFVGIPMIVFAVAILLARPQVVISELTCSPAFVLALACSVFYLRLDLFFGLIMTALLALSVGFAHEIAGLPTLLWLLWGAGLFVLGWFIQFVGHYFEGKKPAFVDDLMGLLIGPLFLVAELSFVFGLRSELERNIVQQVGTTHFKHSAK